MANPPAPFEVDASLQASHDAAMKRISTQLSSFHTTGTPYRIYHGSSTNTTRSPSHTSGAIIDTSSLTNILSLDPTSKRALVEPNVSMSQLATATLKHNLLAPATPEFPAITVGGAFAGTAGESASFRHGFFDRCVSAVTLALPDRRIVRAERDSEGENHEVYAAAVGAMGSLGVALSLELDLVPASQFVCVEYVHVKGVQGALERMAVETKREDVDFVDAVAYGPDDAVVVLGRFEHGDVAARGKVTRFARARDEWFYIHAEKQMRRARSTNTHSTGTSSPTSSDAGEKSPITSTTTELVPTHDFLFRYDRSAFWMGRHAFTFFLCPFTRLTRWALDPLLHTAELFSALHHARFTDRFICQDLVLPYDDALQFTTWLDTHIGVFPLWLCPISATACAHSPMHAPRIGGTTMFCNVGVWGPGRARAYGGSEDKRARWLADNADLEREVERLKGRKWLYAPVFAESEAAFFEGQGLDAQAYRRVREQVGAHGTPSVFEKVRWKGWTNGARKWRGQRFVGLAKAVLGWDAVLVKKK